MIDHDGYRANVGIILCNDNGHLLWAKRYGVEAWQFPQGGIKKNETVEDAMYRELWEEVGLQKEQVNIMGATKKWMRYRLPRKYMRKRCNPPCIGQKQIWYILKLTSSDSDICLTTNHHPEFDQWYWIEYWKPIDIVIEFKRSIYLRALKEFAPLLTKDGQSLIAKMPIVYNDDQ